MAGKRRVTWRETMQRLEEYCATHGCEVVYQERAKGRPRNSAAEARARRAALEDPRLPQTFKDFLEAFGPFYVKAPRDALFFTYPQSLSLVSEHDGDEADNTLAFQRISDDAVDNFYCFNPALRVAGEPAIVAAYHDEPFAPGKKHLKRTFEAHLAHVVNEFLVTHQKDWKEAEVTRTIAALRQLAKTQTDVVPKLEYLLWDLKQSATKKR